MSQGQSPSSEGGGGGACAHTCMQVYDECFVLCMIYRCLIHLLVTRSPAHCLGIFVRFGVRRGRDRDVHARPVLELHGTSFRNRWSVPYTKKLTTASHQAAAPEGPEHTGHQLCVA